MTNTDDTIRESSDLIIAENSETQYDTVPSLELSIDAIEMLIDKMEKLLEQKSNTAIREMIRISRIHVDNLRKRRQFLVDLEKVNEKK